MQSAALPALACGCAAYLWCLWDFAAFGRGTPAPLDAPKRLVARGLYRYVRNPMYVGVLLVIAGWALLFRSPRVLGYGAAVALFFHLFVVAVEEPTLRGKFGRSYEQYCREVGRWVPNPRPIRRRQGHYPRPQFSSFRLSRNVFTAGLIHVCDRSQLRRDRTGYRNRFGKNRAGFDGLAAAPEGGSRIR